MTRWKITIEYNGAPYAGFQKQPDIATVQGEIEKALHSFCQQKVDIVVAARFDAKQKHYTYRIINRPHNLALDQGYAWWAKYPLDIELMNQAAQYLIGEHDFSSFRDSECQAKSPIRSVDELYVEASSIINGQEVLIHAKGMAFLHHMVRNIAGSLVYVGTGKWQVKDMKIVLEAKDRTKAGPTAPAGGLYLQSIDYV